MKSGCLAEIENTVLVRFLCGCTSKEIIARENLETMDRIGYDGEGFIICLDHHQRRYGWRSVPYRANELLHAGHWSELEYEAYVLFGEVPAPKLAKLNLADPELRPDNKPIERWA